MEGELFCCGLSRLMFDQFARGGQIPMRNTRVVARQDGVEG